MTTSRMFAMLVPMTDSIYDLPDDIERLKALLLAERAEKRQIAVERDSAVAERDRFAAQNDRLAYMLRQLRRNHFGRKSERLSDEQLNLGIEDLEAAIASGEAAGEKVDATLKASRTQQRRVNRGHLPTHLPREEIIIDPPSNVCACCGGNLHVIGEDRSERLDKIPAKYRVIVTRRPKYACRSCEKTGADEMAGIIQAPARLVEGGLPTEALVADVVVSKYAWHLPLYRQAQMMATEGIEIDRSTLAHWVGFAAFELRPVYERLIVLLKRSAKLFADETRCPVLDPGRGKTKTGYLWAIARDDRPWGGTDGLAVVLAEVGDHLVVRDEPPEQPNHFKIAACLTLETAARCDAIEVAVDEEPQQDGGMIAGPPRHLGHDVEAKLCEINVRNEGIDRANRIGLVDVVVETFGQERGLPAICLGDEPLHAKLPAADSLKES